MNKVIIDLDLLKSILESESRKCVGKVCKRFELSDDKDTIKKEVKEVLYEQGRDLYDIVTHICKSENAIHLVNLEDQSKERK